MQTAISRKKGIKPIDEVDFAPMKKGRWAEKIVAEYFRECGFKVELTRLHGPDLTIEGHGMRRTIEVKSVRWDESKKTWAFGRVYESRRNDDWLVLVFPDEMVLVYEMRAFLNRPNKRTIKATYERYRDCLAEAECGQTSS